MIVFSHVTQRYKNSGRAVYEDFSAEIRDGEFVVLTGESGSGKTTLIRLLLREIKPDAGEIVVNGQELGKLSRSQLPYYRRRVGVIFQDFRLMRDRNVYDNLAAAIFATGGNRQEASTKIAHVLSMLGIDHLHKRFPREMSGGEQQKVCLARAVINHPTLLLADEPTGNLDPTSTEELIALIELIRRQGVTVILATHDQAVAEGPGRRRIDL